MNDKMFELNIFGENTDDSFENFKVDERDITRKIDEALSKRNISKDGMIKINNPFIGIPCNAQGTSMVLAILLKNEYKVLKKMDKSFDGGIISESLKFENLDEEDSDEDNFCKNRFIKESLNSNETKNFIEQLAEKYQVDLIIPKPNTGLFTACRFLPIQTIEMNKRNEALLYNNDPNAIITFDLSSDIYKIVFIPELLPERFRNEKVLSMLFRHEYGHVKTMNKIKENEWWDYFFKNGIINSLYILNRYIDASEIIVLMNVIHAVYWNLKPEKMANDYTKLDFTEMADAIYGEKTISNWREDKIARLLDIKLPNEILNITKKRQTTGVISNNEFRIRLVFLDKVHRFCFSSKIAEILTSIAANQ